MTSSYSVPWWRHRRAWFNENEWTARSSRRRTVVIINPSQAKGLVLCLCHMEWNLWGDDFNFTHTYLLLPSPTVLSAEQKSYLYNFIKLASREVTFSKKFVFLMIAFAERKRKIGFTFSSYFCEEVSGFRCIQEWRNRRMMMMMMMMAMTTTMKMMMIMINIYWVIYTLLISYRI